MFFLMQNIFIVPAMQHGCRAKPLCRASNHVFFLTKNSIFRKQRLHQSLPVLQENQVKSSAAPSVMIIPVWSFSITDELANY